MLKHILITLTVAMLLLCFILFAIVGIKRFTRDKVTLVETTPQEVFGGKYFVPENHIDVNQNGDYAFVTFEDYGFLKAKIFVMDKYGKHTKKIDESETYSWLGSPKWSPDGNKIVYASVYGNGIYVYDVNSDKNEMIYSEGLEELKQVGSNIFVPVIEANGKIEISWLDNDNIVFENAKEFPLQSYKININDKKTEKYLRDEIVEDFDDDYVIQEFSQKDSLWDSEELGTCEDETIGSAGCAITAIAMLLQYYGYDINPKEVNDKLKENFNLGYFDGCAVKWYMVSSIADDVVMRGAFFNERNYDRLKFHLDRNEPVIVGWNNVAFSPIQHWVLVVDYEVDEDGEESYFTLDPWTGQEKEIGYFGNEFDHMIVYQKIN